MSLLMNCQRGECFIIYNIESEDQKRDYKKQEDKYAISVCKVLGIWNIMGARWSLMILKNLSGGKVMRFNELKRTLPGISSNVLSSKVSQLEEQGLLERRVYEESPPRVEYKLSPLAIELDGIVKGLEGWIDKWQSFKMKSNNNTQKQKVI